MNQTRTSSNHPSSTFTPTLPDQNNFEHSHAAEEYKEKDNHQDIYQGEEQEKATEDSPILTKKLHPKERNQQTKKKKEQIKHHSFLPLDFLQNSEKDHMSLKKISKLPRPLAQARLVSYIPEKNLLIIVLLNLQTVKIYNTITFSLVSVKETTEEVECISYCQKLRRIIAGGYDEFLQLWNPTTFKVEAECRKRNNYHSIRSIAYLSESNAIVAILDNQIRIYNTELRCFVNIKTRLYSGHWYSNNADIVSISKSHFLTFRLDGNRKIPIMFNLNTKCYREFSKEVYIPMASCVEMTENNPKNVFSCLGIFNGKPARSEDERTVYQLVQFTIDTKMDELVPVRSSNMTTHSFRKLNHIENSKYFLAERFEKDSWKTCFLSINKNQVEILRIVSMPSPMILNQVNTYIMTKDGLSLVEADSKHQIIVYRSVIHREKYIESRF